MEYNLEKFRLGLSKLNIDINEKQMQQFITYYEMIIERNKVVNLTAITDFQDVVEKHFLDSLSLKNCIDLNQNKKLLDLGTGAGFPGIPLNIVFPELNVILMDSLNKKIIFLQEVIEELNLKNISALHGRAEEAARKKDHREVYDICVSRAVSNLASLSEYCIPFIKKGGQFVSYKSGEIEEEVNQAKSAIFLLGGKIKDVKKFQLVESEAERSFVIIEKVKGTPERYPRKAGTPSKNPL